MMETFLRNLPPVEGEALAAIADPVPGSAEFTAAVQRRTAGSCLEAMPWLPQLGDEWARDIYDRIENYEREFVAPRLRRAEYITGTAIHPDEVLTFMGKLGNHLFTAEHATTPISLDTGLTRGFPDAGTGGLAAALARDYGTALIMTGMQESNVPSVENHPFKDKMRLHLPYAASFISIHGMGPGKFVRPTDPTEIHACIGLGINPSDEMRTLGRRIASVARETLGLYVVVGNDQQFYTQLREDMALERGEDGQPLRGQLAAAEKPTYTTNVAREELRRLDNPAPALQIELATSLRLTPEDGIKKDPKARIMGVALGYKLIELAVQHIEAAEKQAHR